MKRYFIRYGVTALIALTIGFGFVGYDYLQAPAPEPKIYYAVYMFVWGDHAITARTSVCGVSEGVYYFNAMDHPTGYAFSL